MQKELFSRLVAIIHDPEIQQKLLDLLKELATKAQAAEVEAVVEAAQTAAATATEAVTTGGNPRLLKAGANTWKQTVRLTGYGHKAEAEQNAAQLTHPQVFNYRSALFPNPLAYGIKVKIPSAKAHELKVAINPMYKWAVDMEVEATGDAAKVQSWMAAFENKVRVTNR